MRTIDKDTYFIISEKANLPKRCPILDKCERRALTLFICDKTNSGKSFDEFKAHRTKEGLLEKPIIKQVDDGATYAGGTNNWTLGNICPEVSLFESGIVPFNTRGLAVIRGSYDKYFTSEDKTEIGECGHFSECPEFIKYFESKNSKSAEDVIDIKPNWMGIGINLNALYKKLFKK